MKSRIAAVSVSLGVLMLAATPAFAAKDQRSNPSGDLVAGTGSISGFGDPKYTSTPSKLRKTIRALSTLSTPKMVTSGGRSLAYSLRATQPTSLGR